MPIDYKKYHPEWKSRIVPEILARANNKCEVCGVPNGEIILRGEVNGVEAYQDDNGRIFSTENGDRIGEDYVGEVDKTMRNKFLKVVLTIAHLDHNIDNNNPDNLKAMCQLHHLRYDKHLHSQTRKANREKIQPKLAL